jgi:hypothetical protein
MKLDNGEQIGPELDKLISMSQSASIKKSCIHDTFMFVQEMAKDLHKKKIPTLFMKLDVSRLRYGELGVRAELGIHTGNMKFLGFDIGWRNWIFFLFTQW